MKLTYKSTFAASSIGYICQALVINFAPLLFYTFENEYGGNDRFTSRLLAVMKACCLNAKSSGKGTSIVHFGTATALEDLPDHFPRVIIGGQSPDCVDCTLNVLAGLHESKGHLTYEVNLK